MKLRTEMEIVVALSGEEVWKFLGLFVMKNSS